MEIRSDHKFKILIYSPAFIPLVGGLENMVKMLAEELALLDYEITVITLAKGNLDDDALLNYNIIRNPSLLEYWHLYANCDLILFMNISLKGIWPIFLKQKIRFVSHQITYYNLDGTINLLEKIKRALTPLFKNISCSNFVRSTLPKQIGEVIHNAYDEHLFRILDIDKRENNLVFVGRLVSDKGVDILLLALAYIKKDDRICPKLTIIGDGPELIRLQEIVRDCDLTDDVYFKGKLTGLSLVEELNKHHIMVVPSSWKEPFGLVALEGMACGCQIIVSKNGGLVEACGGNCLQFENLNEKSLAKIIKNTIDKKPLFNKDLDIHLKSHTSTYIAKKYASLFEIEFKKMNFKQ